MERRRLLIVGVAAVVVAGGVVVVTRGGDSGGGGCLPGLAEHLPPDVDSLSGADSVRAEEAGLDLSSYDSLVDATIEAGFVPDPLLTSVLQVSFDDSDDLGYDADDVDCWVGDPLSPFVAEGTFDPDRVMSSEAAGDATAVRGDILAFDRDDDPAPLLDSTPGDAPMRALIRRLDDLGAISFHAISITDSDEEDEDSGGDSDGGGGEERAEFVGVGLAHGDDWELIGAWAFRDADRAAENADRVVEGIEEGNVPDMVAGDVRDHLHRDGAVLWMRAPLTVEPSEWRQPFVQFDPMLGSLLDLSGDDDGGDGDEEGPGDGG